MGSVLSLTPFARGRPSPSFACSLGRYLPPVGCQEHFAARGRQLSPVVTTFSLLSLFSLISARVNWVTEFFGGNIYVNILASMHSFFYFLFLLLRIWLALNGDK